MDKEEFRKLYPAVEEGEVSPEDFHKPITIPDPYDLIPKGSDGNLLIQNEKWDPKWDPKLKYLMDRQFMEGFKTAYDLIDNIFCNYKEPPFDEIWEEIEEEFERYQKDE